MCRIPGTFERLRRRAVDDVRPTMFYNRQTKYTTSKMNHIDACGGCTVFKKLVFILVALTTTMGTFGIESSTAKTIVRKRLLAIRVSSISSGESPEESLSMIQSAIFGYLNANVDDNSNITSVVEQYQFISHGQLLLEPVNATRLAPASPATTDRKDGVFDLYIPNITFAGQVISNLTDIILQETQKQLLSSSSSSLSDIADLFIFCLPTGSSFQEDSNWTAYTYLNQPYSYYQQSRCTRLSVVVHELGHSLGFQHSGVGTSPYADKTGYMGFASNQIGYPRKAFNGHKHWISGWFRDRSAVANPFNGPVEKRLVSFVHYSDSNDQMLDSDTVLIRTGSLYIQFNRAKSYNIDTDMPNTVTITHAIFDDDVSDRLAALSAGETFEYPYTASTTGSASRNVIIQVCSVTQYETLQMDFATIRIYFSDEQNVQDLSDCNKTFISTPTEFDVFESPTSSPAATMAANGSNLQHDHPIVDRDDVDNQKSNIDGESSSSNGSMSSHDSDPQFEGMLYVIIASTLAVILFVGIGCYYVTKHISEQQRVFAIHDTSNDIYPQKLEKKVGSAASSIRNNHQTQRDVEDLSDTAEDDEDHEQNDALYVLYNSRMLEI